jgi:hypothetical protein
MQSRLPPPLLFVPVAPQISLLVVSGLLAAATLLVLQLLMGLTSAFIAARWSLSSAWWLSISRGLGTTIRGFLAVNVSKMLPEPANMRGGSSVGPMRHSLLACWCAILKAVRYST